MIEKAELERIAALGRLAPYQQEKHYVQSVMLWAISGESELVFKGGTALWFFHGLNRFSEDLDFTTIGKINYEKLTRVVQQQLDFRGIKGVLKNIESRAGFTFRVGAEGPLFESESQRCFVRVEISKRKDILLPPVLKIYTPPYNDLSPFSLKVMDEREILAEKVRAVLTRRKARDIFDLAFLISKNVPVDLNLIKRKTERYAEFSLEALKKCVRGAHAGWKKEVGWMVFGPAPEFEEAEKIIFAAF